MEHAIYWNIGKREINQDSLSLQQVLCKRGTVTMALVADGIGGLNAGEIASGYAAEQITEWFYKEAVSYHGRFLRKEKREQLVRSMNRKVHEICEQLSSYGEKRQIDLGTTCVCVLFFNRTFLLMHLGDCNAYYLKGRSIKRLTEPHVEKGGEVNKCIGSMGFYEPDYFTGKVCRHGGMLLCSDGFWKKGERFFHPMLNPKEMQEPKNMERKLQLIGTRIIQDGERDNQSAIYLKW